MLKWTFIILGSTLVILGILTFWLPMPIGLPLILVGLPLVARYSPHGRNWALAATRRFPLIHRQILKFKQKAG